MAARFQIIALTQAPGSRTAWQLVFWYNVPASRQKFYANPAAKSAWVDATGADNTSLQNGSVFEEVVTYSPDPTGQTVGQIEAGAAALWTARNAAFQASNQWANYGTTFDGTTWVVATVA